MICDSDCDWNFCYCCELLGTFYDFVILDTASLDNESVGLVELTFLMAWFIASYGVMLKDWSFVALVRRLLICNYLYFEFLYRVETGGMFFVRVWSKGIDFVNHWWLTGVKIMQKHVLTLIKLRVWGNTWLGNLFPWNVISSYC